MNIAKLAYVPFFKHSQLGNICLKLYRNCRHLSICHSKPTARSVSTYEVKNVQKEESLLRRMVQKIPFLDVNRSRITAAGYIMYEQIADKIDYVDFFDTFNLPDTFYSWFVVTELHIWLLSVRGMAEGPEGRHFRNTMVEALWSDVVQRVKRLGPGSSTEMRERVLELSEQLQAALIAYDEGLQSDDIVLAGALWRRFYQLKSVDPHALELLVKYIRKHITLLDNVSRDQLFEKRTITWDP